MKNMLKKLMIALFLVPCMIGLSACGDKETSPRELSTDMISLSYTSVEYNGEEREPTVTITSDDKVVDAKYYTVDYEDNIQIGTAQVTITANEEAVISGSVTLDFQIVTPAWNGTAKNVSWYNATATSFALKDGAELAGLAKLVNEGNNFAGKTITLANDINLNDKNWTPIGFGSRKASPMVAFNGTFNGNNHTIDNLFVDYDADEVADICVGLFGNVKDATVINVRVNADITTTNDGAGGIAGYGEGQLIIDNCVANGEITGEDGVAGIIGRAYCYSRVGDADDKTLVISNCINNASVSSQIKSSGMVSAISGDFARGFYKTIMLTNCINNGEITSATTGEALNGVQWVDDGNTIAEQSGAMISYLSIPNLTGYSISFTNCKNTDDSVKNRDCASITYNHGYITIINTNYIDAE